MSSESVPDCATQNSNTKSINPARHWCFTLNNYNESEISSIEAKCSIFCEKWVFQEEVGSNNTPHLQGYLCFRKKRRPLGLFDNKRIHWEITRNPEASIRYCSKASDRIPNTRIRTYGIRGLQLLTVRTIGRDQFYPWQARVFEFACAEADERTIYWIYEGKGNTGKSSLCKYLCVHHGAVLISGKGSDIKFGIVKYFERNGRYPELILADIPRSRAEFISYTALEEVKNGCFFSGKYESDMCVFNAPRLICFSNSRPDVEKMSKDRWQIWRITDKDLCFEFA